MRTLTEITKRMNKAAKQTEEKVHKKADFIHKKARKKLETIILSYYAKYGDGKKIEPRRLLGYADRTDAQMRFDELTALKEEHPGLIQTPKKRMTVQDLLSADILLLMMSVGDEEAACVRPALKQFAERSLRECSELTVEKVTKREIKEAAKEMVEEPLAGKTPEESIYANKAKLAEKLSNSTALMVVRGDEAKSVVDYITNLSKKRMMNELDRLVYTENTFLIEQAPVLMIGNDFSEYEFVTSGDDHVCEVCRPLNFKVFRLADEKPGLNAPPMHPWCRCWTRMHVSDATAWIERYMRFHGCSRDEAEDVLYHATK